MAISLSTVRNYGNGQRVGFAAVCIGFVFCFIGAVSPYWFTAKADKIPEISGLVKAEIHAGIWVYCYDVQALGMTEAKCFSFYNNDNHDYEINDRSDWINIVRAFVSFNIILSFCAMCVACCRCLCCSGGRTVCHGILSFLAGGCGGVACVITFEKTKDMLNIPIVDTDYDWAFTLFILGCILMIVASLLLCFAVPRQMYASGVIIGQPMSPGISVNVNNTNAHTMTNQYVNAGQINSFEPLPQVPPPYAQTNNFA